MKTSLIIALSIGTSHVDESSESLTIMLSNSEKNLLSSLKLSSLEGVEISLI